MKKKQYLILGSLFLLAAVLNLLSASFSEGTPSTLIVISSALFAVAAAVYFYQSTRVKKDEKETDQ
ncbi:MAG: hypothetical protein AAF849_09575 [Bacteroidota bacterium]